MSTVDERVVAMKMDYSSLDKGVSASTSALEKLKKALSFDKESKSIQDLDATAKKFSLENISAGVDAIVSKFGALSIVGITALTNIANKAVDAGLTIARSLTIDPVKAGFDEYELKMGSIQTILANTARYGTQLGDVTGALDELNKYADKTIYNFGDMTKNIGLFTNAGIRVEDATSMIKGFSNEAAASGTTAAGAAGAAYQLSQALSAGTIRLMDWRSLTNVGMGNKNMQNGLIEIADAMGTLTANSIDAATVQADFNGSLEKNWLSADVMSTYLKIMAGEMDAASMSAMGLSDAQIAAFQQQAATAEDAATKVRTWTQLIGTLQESVGSGWAQTFDILIGDFNSATELFTGVNNKLGPLINAMSDARNKIAEDFVKFGGRTNIIEGMSTAFDNLMNILRVVRRAFEDIFPPVTGQQLAILANGFRILMLNLTPTPEVFRQIQSVAKGFFAALDIGRMIIVEVAKVIGRVFGAMSGVGGGALEAAANIGDMIVAFRDAIKEGTALNKIFTVVGDALVKVVDVLRKMGEFTASIINLENFRAVWEGIAQAIGTVGRFLEPAVQWIKEAFSNIRNAVGEFFKTMDFNVLIGLLNVGAIGGLGLLLKKAFDGIKTWWDEFSKTGIMSLLFGKGTGEPGPFKQMMSALTDSLNTMQQSLKVGQLVAIAAAIALLAGSLLIMSNIDTAQLYISIGAMSIMFAQLSGAMIVLDKFAASGGAVKMAANGAAMIAMGTAMVILAGAVKIFSTMDWEELARGFAALAAGMGIMVGAMSLVHSKVFAAASMILISSAMVILAGALKIMASMSWDDIFRAMTVLASSIAVLVAAMTMMHSKVFAAASMTVIAVAMTVLAGAMKLFATMSWDEIGRSMVVLGGSLAILAVALELIHSKVFAAASLLVISVALTVLAGALKVMGSMSWDEIGRGMIVLAGSLAILAGAMALMGIPLVLLGSVGILAASAAMMMLAPALLLMGTMSWDEIGRGLALLASALGILAVGGLLLLPAIPGFVGLGIAIALIGAGVMAAGIGLSAMAVGITALAAASTIGAEAIKMALTTLISLIPEAMAAFAQGLIDFAVVIATGGAEFTKAMTVLMMSLLQGIKDIAPMIIDTIWTLILNLVEKAKEGVPQFVDAALVLMTNFLNTLADRLPLLIDAGTNVIVKFVEGVGRSASKITSAASDTIVKFVNEMAATVERDAPRLRAAAVRLADAIIDGMSGGLWSRAKEVGNAAAQVAANALNAAKSFLGINSPSKEFFKIGSWSSEGLSGGLIKSASLVTSAAKFVANKALDTMSTTMSKIGDAISSDIDLNPVITPVIDLTQFSRDAQQINSAINSPKLNLNTSIASANMASAAVEENEAANAEYDASTRGDTYYYTQNNTSPKALSQAEIYRQTKNQISTIQKNPGSVVTTK